MNQPSPPRSEKKRPKTGGLFSQFLEFFGMTPSLPSEYLNSESNHHSSSDEVVVWRCKSCHNPAHWKEEQQRWQCKNHPQAQVVDSL